MGLVRIPYASLQTGMLVAKADLRVYEVLIADRVQAIMLKDKKTAVVITATEFDRHEWYTSVPDRKRRKNGKD